MDILEEALEQNLLAKNNGSGNGSVDILDDQDEEERRLFEGNDIDKDFLEGDDFASKGSSSSSCKRILYETLDGSTRVWDVLILIPNLIFLLFLLYRLRAARRRLAATNAPVLAAFHVLVLVCAAAGVLRCLVSIVNCNVASQTAFNGLGGSGQTLDKVLWVLLRAFLLATEISVMAFALLSGHLESRGGESGVVGVRRVVGVASTVSLIFSCLQLAMEFGHPDSAFTLDNDDESSSSLFGHGGRTFWAVSSALFAALYALVLLLPHLPVAANASHSWLTLPHKRSFYYYAGFLLVLDAVQAIACGLTESDSNAVSNPGLCLLNMATYIYFVAFPPIVYFTFMAQFFGSKFAPPSMLFAYKAQTNDFEEDDYDLNLQTGGGNGGGLEESRLRPCHLTLDGTGAGGFSESGNGASFTAPQFSNANGGSGNGVSIIKNTAALQ